MAENQLYKSFNGIEKKLSKKFGTLEKDPTFAVRFFQEKRLEKIVLKKSEKKFGGLKKMLHLCSPF